MSRMFVDVVFMRLDGFKRGVDRIVGSIPSPATSRKSLWNGLNKGSTVDHGENIGSNRSSMVLIGS